MSRHAFRESVDDCLDVFLARVFNKFALNGVETERVEPIHTGTPGNDRSGVGKRERYPLDLSWFYFFRVFQREGTRGEVARVGIVLATLHDELIEVVVGDDGLATNHHVSLLVDALRYAADGVSQMSDVCSNVAVAACDDFCQPTTIVGDDECQTIELPRNPYRSFLSPLHQIAYLFCFGQ